MNNETIEMLKVLADKLGTTIEHLWDVLINQAFLSGIASTVFLAVMLIITVLWVRVALARIKKEEENGYYSSSDDSVFLWFTIILLIPACGTISTILMYEIVTAFLNPEYWALREILRK